MSAVNAVEPTRREQDFIDMEREIASLRRQLEESKRETGRARKGENDAKKQIEELTTKLANETRAANAYWSSLKRLRRNMELMTAMASNSTSEIDEGLNFKP